MNGGSAGFSGLGIGAKAFELVKGALVGVLVRIDVGDNVQIIENCLLRSQRSKL